MVARVAGSGASLACWHQDGEVTPVAGVGVGDVAEGAPRARSPSGVSRSGTAGSATGISSVLMAPCPFRPGAALQRHIKPEPLGDLLESGDVALPALPACEQADRGRQQAGGSADLRRGGEALVLAMGVDDVAQADALQPLGSTCASYCPACPCPAAFSGSCQASSAACPKLVLACDNAVSRKSEADAELPPRRSNPSVQTEPAPGPYSPPSPASLPRWCRHQGGWACDRIQRRPIR